MWFFYTECFTLCGTEIFIFSMKLSKSLWYFLYFGAGESKPGKLLWRLYIIKPGLWVQDKQNDFWGYFYKSAFWFWYICYQLVFEASNFWGLGMIKKWVTSQSPLTVWFWSPSVYQHFIILRVTAFCLLSSEIPCCNLNPFLLAMLMKNKLFPCFCYPHNLPLSESRLCLPSVPHSRQKPWT